MPPSPLLSAPPALSLGGQPPVLNAAALAHLDVAAPVNGYSSGSGTTMSVSVVDLVSESEWEA